MVTARDPGSPVGVEKAYLLGAGKRARRRLFFFSSRRRHTRSLCDWSQTCALPISVGRAGEADALAISGNIQARHMPFSTLLDPIYASPSSSQIIGYTRCGDSALWTGAYLAAESFR